MLPDGGAVLKRLFEASSARLANGGKLMCCVYIRPGINWLLYRRYGPFIRMAIGWLAGVAFVVAMIIIVVAGA